MGSLEQFLVFQLGEAYGIAIRNVVEVLEVKMDVITRIPRTPCYMLGIINNRGKLTPIIDLRLQLGMEALENQGTMANVIILAFPHQGEKVSLGILVDSVREVTEFAGNEIEPRPTLGTRVQPAFIQGMGNKNGSFTILLDIERIFNIDILSSLQNPTLQGIGSESSYLDNQDLAKRREEVPVRGDLN